jgi:hypothetical protein
MLSKLATEIHTVPSNRLNARSAKEAEAEEAVGADVRRYVDEH